MAQINSIHRHAFRVICELMREFIGRQRQARKYNQFLRSKIEAGRASMQAGRGYSNDEVKTKFAARRRIKPLFNNGNKK